MKMFLLIKGTDVKGRVQQFDFEIFSPTQYFPRYKFLVWYKPCFGPPNTSYRRVKALILCLDTHHDQ